MRAVGEPPRNMGISALEWMSTRPSFANWVGSVRAQDWFAPATSVERANARQTSPNAPGITSRTPRPSPSSSSRTPPGASARASRLSTSSRSAMCSSTNRVWTKSKALGGSSSATRSNWAISPPRAGKSARCRGSASTASTRPAGKTALHSHRANDPPPAPASKQRLPGPTPNRVASETLSASYASPSKARRSPARSQSLGRV